jgi:hypothetical protein
MNWGWKITLAYSGFVLYILFLVFRANGVDFELVTPDYYSAELAFQSQIDKKKEAVSRGFDVELHVVGDEVLIKYPDYSKSDKVSGKVSFFRPSGAALDRDFEWIVDENGSMQMPKSSFERGHYTFTLDCQVNGRAFLVEKPVFIP